MNLPYRQEQDVYLIEVKLSDPRQLFNSLDPAPFIEKDLDHDAEEYIIDSVRDFHLKTPLRLVIYFPQNVSSEAARGVPEAIHNYFKYRAAGARRELKFTLRQGRHSLLIGLTFLFVCVSVRQILELTTQAALAEILEEGLLIMGWVAMWQPLQTFLYDWWPIRGQRLIYEKLQQMPIDVRLSDVR